MKQMHFPAIREPAAAWIGQYRKRYRADDIPNTGSFRWSILDVVLPEGVSTLENVYLKIRVNEDGRYVNSEFFTISE